LSVIKGYASFKSTNKILITDNNNKEKIIETEKTVICTGSEPVPLPKVDFDEQKILSSTGALSLKSVPKKMVIIGGGYIGLEMGSVWSRLGSEIQVIEFLDHITPGMDSEISKEFLKILQKQGIKFHLESKVESVKRGSKGMTIKASNKEGKKIDIECDVVLVAVGRKPNTEKLNLGKIGIELDSKKRIKVDKKYQTNVKNIFAIGDVIEGPMLAHKAEDEGIAVAEIIDGQAGHVNYDVIPSVVYTSPEVATVGKLKNN
jgi:dihydrolipoamide dehydrogenase